MTMTDREKLLREAIEIVTKDRNSAYGDPEDNFQNIADFWNVYLEQIAKSRGLNSFVQLRPVDIALMMDLMKTARLTHNPTHKDSWLDKPGYSACGWDIVKKGTLPKHEQENARNDCS